MNRFSILYRTEEDGRDVKFRWAEGTEDFLQSIGATNPDGVLTLTAEYARGLQPIGFEELPGEMPGQASERPVALRFVPMHLYRFPGMSGMKPFYTVSVSGKENRVGSRGSCYTMLTLIDGTLKNETEGYNYLDQIFGTKIVSWKDVGRYYQEIDYCSVPQKVTVTQKDHDRNNVIRAAEAILGGKAVILKLERDEPFNARSVELLKAIYSLLPAAFAWETGFASYQNPLKIRGLYNDASGRVFTVTADADTNMLSNDTFFVIDMNEERQPLEKTPLQRALYKWWTLPWEQRCRAMEGCFGSVDVFGQDLARFPEITDRFFEALDDLENWSSDPSATHSVKSLEELKQLYDAHPLWEEIPWAEEVFKAKIPSLMAEKKFNVLLAETVNKYYFANEEDGDRLFPLIKFGTRYGNVHVDTLCDSLTKQKEEIDTAAFQLEKDALAKEHEKALALKDAALQQAAENFTEVEEEYKTKLQKKEIELKDMESEFNKKISAKDEMHRDELAASEDRHEEEIAQLKEAAEKEKVAACAVAEEGLKKAEQVFKQQKADIAREKESRKQVEGELLSERESHRKTKERLSDVRNERDHLSRDLEDAEDQIDNLGSWPQFLTKMPWWLSLVIALLIGAILVGAVWGITIFVGKDEEEELVATEAVSATQMPTETTMDTTIETAEAVPETTELQPDPTFVYNDWQNEETARQLRLAVPDIVTVQTDEAVQVLCPTELEGYTVQALLSTDEIIFMSEEGEEQTFSEENYALLLLKTENAEEIDLTTLHEPVLAMQKDNQILLSYGNDQMMNAAICTIQTITAVPVDNPSEEVADEYAEVPDNAEVSDVEGESVYEDNESDITEEPKDVASEPFRMLWIFEDGNVIDLGTAIASIMETDDWWKTVSEWSTDSTDLQALNLSRTPILTISVSENRYYLYDFSDNLQEEQKFVGDNEDWRIEQLGNFVLAEETVEPQG